MFYQKQTIELIDKYLKISQQVKTIAEKLDDELCGETKTEQNKTSSKDIKLPNLPKLPNIETKQQQFPSASLPTKKNMLNVDKKKEDTTTKEEQVKKENETKNFQIKIESNEENEEEIRKKTMSIFQSEFLSACNDGNDELQENIFKNIQHNNGGVLNSILFPELNKGDCEPIKIDLSNTAFVFAPPPPPLISREIGEKLKLSRKNINEMKELSEEIKLPLQELKRNPKDIKLVKKILEAENRMQNCIKCIEKELNALESEKSDKAQ
ncbi:hypothetical protein GPJ56_005910 [Histomonas meleagridis]|uniref:uncharacterized protein n=1 Tax=Histomonas meleagridis TaxID=135588 RepID=UPI003559E965|nr:hypothetical protein GPJ56_005910 [Histomonas meleagridis]KAH0801926.1 hypothetical protein GO595_005344 [Histomonas meleagridis]